MMIMAHVRVRRCLRVADIVALDSLMCLSLMTTQRTTNHSVAAFAASHWKLMKTVDVIANNTTTK